MSSAAPERLPRDPSKPLPGEVKPHQERLYRQIVGGTIILALGIVLGFLLTPETSDEANARIAELETQLRQAKDRVMELDRAIKYRAAETTNRPGGKLRAEDRKRHERESKRYAKILRSVKAQSAADLMQWFVSRWNALLDSPGPDDRVGRRAELLSLLIGGMAQNLDPGDYVPWQAEFLNGNWLGDVHFDLDGDGFPGKRSMKNPHDGFVDASVCQIAMALNQATRDARVLVMPDMKCDTPQAKMSVFMQGSTLDDALDDFVKALEREGFLAVQKTDSGIRLILIGTGSRGRPRGD